MLRPTRASFIALAAACVAGAACGSFGDASSAAGDASTNPDSGPGNEALDATAEANVDAAIAPDAAVGADAAKVPDASPPALKCNTGSDYHCADFESGGSTFTGTDSITSGGSIGIDETRSHRGTSSLLVRLGTGASPTAVRSVPAPQVPGFYVRFFVHVPVDPPAAVKIMTVTTTGKANGFELAVATNGTLQNIFYFPANVKSSSAAIVGAGFRCVEWHLTQTKTRVFVDDVEITSLEVTRAPGSDVLETLGVGTYYYNANVTKNTDVWYDDLVVAPSQVGCKR